MSIKEPLELLQTSIYLLFLQIHIPLHRLIPAARITMKIERLANKEHSHCPNSKKHIGLEYCVLKELCHANGVTRYLYMFAENKPLRYLFYVHKIHQINYFYLV